MSSLTEAELAWLAEHIRLLPGDWTLEPVAEPAELSAILLPAEGDRFAATFLVDRVEDGIRVMACRWDVMHAVGVFPMLEAAWASIATAATSAAQTAPFPNLQ